MFASKSLKPREEQTPCFICETLVKFSVAAYGATLSSWLYALRVFFGSLRLILGAGRSC